MNRETKFLIPVDDDEKAIDNVTPMRINAYLPEIYDEARALARRWHRIAVCPIDAIVTDVEE